MLKQTPRIDTTGASQGENDLSLLSLFEREESPLLRYAFSLTGRRAIAEEIVQEVFLLLHKNWEEVENPKAWLFRTVRNTAFNHIRNNQHETLNLDLCGNQSAPLGDETPDVFLLRMEAAGQLRHLLSELSETDRRLVKLKYFHDLKYREISDETGLSVTNVGYRLHSILKDLAKKLSPFGIEEIS